MYAIKIYKDENRLLGPFDTESDATAYRNHILVSTTAEIIPMMAPIDSVLEIARRRAEAMKGPPPAIDD